MSVRYMLVNVVGEAPVAVDFGADLSGANLSGANLSGADLSGANLSRAARSRFDAPIEGYKLENGILLPV